MGKIKQVILGFLLSNVEDIADFFEGIERRIAQYILEQEDVVASLENEIREAEADANATRMKIKKFQQLKEQMPSIT